jgi:hypothetical protein
VIEPSCVRRPQAQPHRSGGRSPGPR